MADTTTTVGQRSAGEILQNVVRDIGDVVRGEVRLARAEIGEKVSKAGKAGGLMGGAAVCGLLGAGALVAAAIAALALVMALWLAALLIGIVLTAGGAALFTTGRTKLKSIDPVPENTVQTLKDDVQWAKHRTT
jgi:hypothetical protein